MNHFSYKGTIAFLRLAARQKNPDWLVKNRGKYEELVQHPLHHLADTLASALSKTAVGYHFPRRGIGRIKRMSPDPEPEKGQGGIFKAYLSYTASRPSGSRFEKNPSLYFGIHGWDDDDPFLVAGGLYMPSSPQIKAIRTAIVSNSDWLKRLEKLFKNKAFKARFPGGFSLERMQTRPPRGFPADHPRAEWLKLQGFYVWRSYGAREISSPGFAQIVAKDMALALQLNELLEEVARSQRSPKVMPQAPAPRVPRKVTDRLKDLEGPRYQADF